MANKEEFFDAMIRLGLNYLADLIISRWRDEFPYPMPGELNEEEFVCLSWSPGTFYKMDAEMTIDVNRAFCVEGILVRHDYINFGTTTPLCFHFDLEAKEYPFFDLLKPHLQEKPDAM